MCLSHWNGVAYHVGSGIHVPHPQPQTPLVVMSGQKGILPAWSQINNHTLRYRNRDTISPCNYVAFPTQLKNKLKERDLKIYFE